MTPLAVAKILYAESALVVVAGETTLRALRRMVHQGLRRCDLPRLRHSGSDAVTISTTQSLTRAVLSMTEAHSVGARLRRSPRVTARAVAHRA